MGGSNIEGEKLGGGGGYFCENMSRGCSQYGTLQLSFVVSESQNTESFASTVKFRGID